MWRCALSRVWQEWWESDAGQCLLLTGIIGGFALLCVGLWHGIRALAIYVFGLETAYFLGGHIAWFILLILSAALLIGIMWGVVLGIRRVCQIVRECRRK